jgi:hypothetical protein
MSIIYKVGDKVTVRRECSGCIPGKIYTICSISGKLYAMDPIRKHMGVCYCRHNWILVTKKIKEYGIAKFMRGRK